MKRALRIILTVLAALVAAAVALVVFVLFTTPGAELVLDALVDRGVPVRAQSIEGALGRRFILLGVELKAGPVQGTVDTLIVAWRPLALRKRLIAVDELTAIHAQLHIIDTPDSGAAAERAEDSQEQAKRWLMDAKHVVVRRSSLEAGAVHLHDIDAVGSGGWHSYRADVRASGSLPRVGNVDAFVRATGDANAATADSLEARVLGGVVRGDAIVRWNDGLSWRAHLRGESVHAAHVADSSADWLGAVDFEVRSDGAIDDETTRVHADVVSLESVLRGRPLSLQGKFDVDGSRIEASDTRVQWGSTRATISGSMGDVADIQLDANIASLSELIPRAHGSAAVVGRVTGGPTRIDVTMTAQGRGVGVGRYEVPNLGASLDATLAAHDYVPEGATVRRLEMTMGEGRAHAAGDVAWKSGITWDGEVEAQRIEAALFTPPQWNLYGPLSLTATSHGSKRGRELRASASVDSLWGVIRHEPLSASGSIAVVQSQIDVDDFRVRWGGAHARIDGIAGDTLAADFDITVPDLALVDSTASGAFSAAGRVRGTRRHPGVDATVSADSVSMGEYAVRELRGTIDADVAFASGASIDLLALNASRGTTTFDTVIVTFAGPRGDHRASLHAASRSMTASVGLRGAYADSAWTGWVDRLDITHRNAGAWSIDHRAPLLLSRARVDLDSLSLSSGSAHLAGHGWWRQQDGAHAECELKEFEMARVQALVAAGASVTGTANATLKLDADPGQGTDVQLNMEAGPGELSTGDLRIPYHGIVNGRADSTGVAAKADIDLGAGERPLATVDADMRIDGFVLGRDSLGSQAIAGVVDVSCSDIGDVLALFAPALGKASGTLTAHAEPVGTVDDFRMVGRMSLAGGRLDLRSGLRLRDAELEMVSDEQGGLTVDGHVTSGGGRVVLGARSSAGAGPLDAVITAKGERFQLINQPDAQVFVSPDVEVRIAERRAIVTGDVRVPFARIETTQVPATAVAPSNDVVFAEDTLATEPKVDVQTQVRVTLGDSVSFSGFGLRARLAGSLSVEDEGGRPTRGTGEIQILDGRYRAFGSELTIDTGRLVFGGGPIDNPGLDIRAYRGLTTQTVMATSGEIVGIHLRGTLRKPEFSVFSNPPMSESEIMSYLVLGRPMSSSSGEEQSALANAAMLIGMQKGTSVAGEIGGKLALDEAYLESGSDLKETSFVAGKYLSPKLYVSYATGLFEQTNTFRARYSLSKHWTLQAENGKANSSDLLYWFERGK